MQATFTISSHHVATLRFDESQVNGYGAIASPRLMLQCGLDISYPNIGVGRRLDLLRMTGRIQFGHNLYVEAIPAVLSLNISESQPFYPDYPVNFEFPTTQTVP